MSRIGKLPVNIPPEVQVTVDGNAVKVKGPKGELTREFHKAIKIRKEDNKIIVERTSDLPFHRSLHGLTRTLINNMVEGVTKGFSKSLDITGVGYRASKQGRKLILALGYSHPVEYEPQEGVEIEVPAPNKMIVKGIDKEAVGAVAAKIRSFREPEPYKGKGIRYSDEVIKRKVGKTGGKGKK